MYRSRPAVLLILATLATLSLSNVLYADVRNNVRAAAEAADAEFEIELRKAACDMAELAVAEVEVALERVALRLEQATTLGTEHDVANVKLDQKEANLQLSMRKLQLKVSQTELERAKSRLEYLRRARLSRPNPTGDVRIEYVDDLDVLVIRGAKEDVARITEVIKQIQKKKEAKEE